METKGFENWVPGDDNTQSPNTGQQPQTSGKKISTGEGFLMVMFVFIVDMIEILLNLFLVGVVVNSLVNIPTAGFIQLWTRIKGIKGTASLAGSLIEFIPVINILPIRTATMIITIYLANKPTVSKIAGAAKGKVDAKNAQIKSDAAHERMNAANKEGFKTQTPIQPKAPSFPGLNQPIV